MIGTIVASIAKAVVAPVANYMGKREDTKQAKNAGEVKISAMKVGAEKEVTLTDQEWEAIAISKSDSTWKDEYVTIVITSPIVLLLVGAVYGSITGDMSILTGTVDGLAEIAQMGVDMELLMEIVVYAAVGLKVLKSTLKV